uniref:HAT C-terminal dimerisation domain-containing protein n=1 Tax=Nothobranchius rachovii TaxID=451742 RepID=A0A1A8SKG2_9TELE
MVLKKIRDNYDKADDAGFALKVMELGTDVENQSVVVRFVCNGIPKEHLIGLLDPSQLNAEFITTQILEHLSDSGYSTAEIISQCYDGASVMIGLRGGVQALLQKKVGKDIPYIHCYNHQLHLAVVHAMQAEPCAKTFFALSGSLHSFFHRHYVSQNYDVPSLKRLLEIRWTSHHDGTKCLVENQDAVMSILSEKMTGSDSDKLSNEILVAKIMLEKEFKKADDDNSEEFVDLSTICKYLHGYKNAFPQLHRMFVASLVIGISAASCESSFSTLSRVLTRSAVLRYTREKDM